MFRSWLGGKAKALADAIGELNQPPRLATWTSCLCCGTRPNGGACSRRKAGLLINATASLVAREAIGGEAPGTLPQVIETMLYADGAVGLLTTEGADRNPNCLDLMAEAYALIGAHARLRPLVFGPGRVSRQRIGEGSGRSPWRFPTRGFR